MNETVQHIAQQLNETNEKPIAQIAQILELIGEEETLSYLQKTQEIEAGDGMKTEKGDRRRTPGGVFFYLVRGGMTWSQRRAVFPYFNPNAKQPPPQKKEQVPPYKWLMRIADFKRFKPEDIGVGKVEIKVVGKPLKVIEKSQVTVVTMRSGEPPSLPKGLPAAPSTPTIYLILIAAKQWSKVKEYASNPENKLIVKGWPVFDKKLGTITVLAQNTTATLLEKEKQQARAQGEAVEESSDDESEETDD
jgi:hypothetical protein